MQVSVWIGVTCLQNTILNRKCKQQEGETPNRLVRKQTDRQKDSVTDMQHTDRNQTEQTLCKSVCYCDGLFYGLVPPTPTYDVAP